MSLHSGHQKKELPTRESISHSHPSRRTTEINHNGCKLLTSSVNWRSRFIDAHLSPVWTPLRLLRTCLSAHWGCGLTTSPALNLLPPSQLAFLSLRDSAALRHSLGCFSCLLTVLGLTIVFLLLTAVFRPFPPPSPIYHKLIEKWKCHRYAAAYIPSHFTISF